MKRTPYIFRFGILFCVLLTGCSESSSQWAKWSVPPKAENIQNYDFSNGQAHQVSFDMTAEYPSKLIAEFYSKQVTSPWTRCYQEMEWQSFGDVSRAPHTFIHQMLLHWVNYESERLLVLGVQYVSQGDKFRKVPDNQIQNAHLVEYQEVSLEEAVSRLNLSCEES